MSGIIGNTVGTPTPRPNFNQTDPTKADYIIGREDIFDKNHPFVSELGLVATDSDVGVFIYPVDYVPYDEDAEAVSLEFYGNRGDEPVILRNVVCVKPQDAASKGYVDGLVGDIETALDAIIAIQNNLIGGSV